MKKFDVKSMVLGLGIGIIGALSVWGVQEIKSTTINKVNDSAVFATVGTKAAATSNSKVTNDFRAGETKVATISNAKVYFNGNEVKLKNPLITVSGDGSSEEQLYMPMSELLEYMQFKVEWNSKDSSVNLTMNGQDSNKNTEVTSYSSDNEIDTKAIEVIQKTGNWKYIEPYLSDMSADGITKVVEIYNSKHMNPSEHKKASDYIKN
jgi:hypothetical protein